MEQFPDLCIKGPSGEVAFYVNEDNLELISGTLGFTTRFTKVLGERPERRTGIILSYHRFEGREDAHCQVYLGAIDNEIMLVFDPDMNDFLEIPIARITEWQGNLVLVTRY